MQPVKLTWLEEIQKYSQKSKSLTMASSQTKIRQVRRSATYQFDCLIQRDYKHALELDKQNGNARWYDATNMEIDQINEYQVFKIMV